MLVSIDSLKRHKYLCVLILVLISIIIVGCWTYVDKNAMQAFTNRKQQISVTVYPVNIVKGTRIVNDSELAKIMVTFLSDNNLAIPILGSKDHSYPFIWGMNQAKMSQRSANAFAVQVKQDMIPTDYALLVEILCNEVETNVFGVSYYLVDKEGKIADGSLSNSDWKDFKVVKPYNRLGGFAIAKRMILRNWKGEEMGNGAN
jgi:hypothetical protein